MKKIILFIFIAASTTIFSQSFNCNTAQPFCTGTTYADSTFYFDTSSSSGISFGCIPPNSSEVKFYKTQAQTSGSVVIQVAGSVNMDLICWGGVLNYQDFCGPGSVTNTLACSSSTSTTESITFNVIAGQYYLIGVTSPTFTTTQFTLSQVAGNGSLCINACSKPIPTPTLCYVTSNNNLNNEIYFNSYTSTFKKGTIIYRENSMSLWDSIGYVPSGQPDKFIDVTSNTNQQAYRYSIAHLDSCNNIQLKSAIHKTILLQSSLGTGSQINLSWNLYQGLTVNSYYIFRGTTTSNMQVINTVSGSTTAYTDLTPPAGTNLYKIAIKTPTNCTSSAAALDTVISSNYKIGQISTGINNYESDYAISIHPNPASSVIYINTKDVAESIVIIDLTGKELLFQKPKSNEEVINLESLSSGIYFMKITINNHQYYKKIILCMTN